MKIGCVAELECITELVKLGYQVSIPYGDCARYDLIVDVGGKLLKIQVKTSSEMLDGKGFKFPTRGSGKKYVGDIDAFMTSYDGNIYLIPIEEASSTEQKLWFYYDNKDKVKYASEYLLKYQIEKFTYCHEIIKNNIKN